MNIYDYCIDGKITMREAMKKLGNLEPQIVFIISSNKPVASLTDGDIRRCLMAGSNFEEPAKVAANTSPKIVTSAAEAEQLLLENPNFKAIPIVDEEGKLVDVYLGKAKEKDQLGLPVVINAGGKGTRLEPFTKVLPKPLIPVGDLPIMEHIMHNFVDYGCNEFHCIVNYKKQLMKAYFAENENNYDVSWYDEEQPLGTGGGLSLLKGKINSTFFFTNCDILLNSSYECIYDFHKKNGNVITMICAYKNLKIPYGVIEMGENGSIEEMREKPEISFLTNTGVYIVEPEVLDDIEDNVAIGFPDIIEQQMAKGKKVAVYPVSENEWLDMGQLSELEKMRVKLYGE